MGQDATAKTAEPRGRFGAGGRIALWGGAALLLLLPLAAMQVADEVNWTRLDFAVFGGLLLVTCGSFELAMRLTASRRYRIVAALAIAAAFLFMWANLAVGIWGD